LSDLLSFQGKAYSSRAGILSFPLTELIGHQLDHDQNIGLELKAG